MNNAAIGTGTGYAIRERLFQPSEMAALLELLAGLDLPRSRAGSRHVLGVKPIEAIANDSRLLEVAAEWSRARATPFRATLFDKSPDANWLVAWHQDTALPLEERADVPGWGPWSEKQGITYAHAPAHVLSRVIALRVNLDDCTDENGPLRVLPGTHALGLLSDAEVLEQARRVEAVSCKAPAGSVVAMRPLIIHASSKATSDTPRRVLHIEYAASLELEGGLKLRRA